MDPAFCFCDLVKLGQVLHVLHGTEYGIILHEDVGKAGSDSHDEPPN